METLATVLTCPIKDCWATSIDLKDAYLHVPIHPNDQKWLKFMVRDQTYMFRCLPFGLSTAPRVFTRIVKTVAAYLCVYLDDWLIYSRSRVEALHHIKMVQETVTSLGFVINVKKSNFVPTQIPSFWGPSALIGGPGQALSGENYEHNTMRQDSQCRKSRSSHCLAKSVRTHGQSSRPGAELSYAYETNSAAPTGVLQTQLPLSLQDGSNVGTDPRQTQVVVHDGQPEHRGQISCPLLSLPSRRTRRRWAGGHIQDQTASGLWSPTEAKSHINLLELWAVERTIQAFEDQLMGCKFIVQSDNSTVVAYINKQGGTKSPLLCMHTLRLLKKCHHRGMSLKAIHIAGVTNILADDLSRGRGAGPTEWALSPQVVQTISE
ncbi:uncharacterized protein [Amphiura filiformis]|uniref:uncharacterized protein n=1 Tax=Amphiura filiformis TaxID=82378 RepID=UPI003B20D4B6